MGQCENIITVTFVVAAQDFRRIARTTGGDSRLPRLPFQQHAPESRLGAERELPRQNLSPDSDREWRRGQRLTPRAFELPHELHQGRDPGLGEGVIDRRPHPADRPVALEPVEPGLGGRLREYRLELLVG